MSTLPNKVRVVEVGPRDGLQNEKQPVPTEVKIELIDRLGAAGLPAVELTSFVSPKWVPQLADAEAVLAGVDFRPGTDYPVLVPNMKGLERAMAGGVREIAVFTAASESFNRRNINAGIDESFERIAKVVTAARDTDIKVRGYVSCVLGCPYEGEIDPGTVASVSRRLLELGCYEISLGDTIGAGTPLAAREMLETVAGAVPISRLAIHFHDTRGQALANILACLETGVATVDASVAGLGGCPYARGASGNVATEDLVYMLHGMGIQTGIDARGLMEASLFISRALGRPPASKLGMIAALAQDGHKGTKTESG
ncbi:MAG: hydroxymethylglutaryl-CoA lyase [Gammaproteobacteria bacterium]|jgi:isopropylmalate/homocitrate/citramalate synthase